MAWVRHDAGLNVKATDGAPRREHLLASARRGNAQAIAALEGPPFPEALSYLYDWALELVGRSGADMGGLAPLGYGTVAAWAALTDRHPAPHEVTALMQLDAILRSPDPGEKEG